MVTETRTSPESEASEDVAAPPPPSGIRTDLDVAAGALAGAAAGALAGPVGAIVGAGIGTAVAVLADEALSSDQAERAARERQLDRTIGVTDGSIGGPAEAFFVTPPDVAAYLRGEHDDLETRASGLLAIVEEGDRDAMRQAFDEMEERIVAHLDLEERELFPRYAVDAPEDARQLVAEHDAFRKALAELDVAIDLHAVRLEMIRELVALLAAHAHRENVTVYRWAASRAG